MKFIAGLLLGGLATLLIATLADYRWEPPSRLKVVAASTAPPSSAIAQAPALKPEVKVEPPAPPPIRSVTIEPLLAEPAPTPAPALTPVPAAAPAPALAPALALPRELASQTVPVSPSEVATAVVWKPFHSEVSATGFARRLSTQLGYPFRALREGPARYHVVFDYDTEQQRELLQQQVTALTGFVAI